MNIAFPHHLFFLERTPADGAVEAAPAPLIDAVRMEVVLAGGLPQSVSPHHLSQTHRAHLVRQLPCVLKLEGRQVLLEPLQVLFVPVQEESSPPPLVEDVDNPDGAGHKQAARDDDDYFEEEFGQEDFFNDYSQLQVHLSRLHEFDAEDEVALFPVGLLVKPHEGSVQLDAPFLDGPGALPSHGVVGGEVVDGALFIHPYVQELLVGTGLGVAEGELQHDEGVAVGDDGEEGEVVAAGLDLHLHIVAQHLGSLVATPDEALVAGAEATGEAVGVGGTSGVAFLDFGNNFVDDGVGEGRLALLFDGGGGDGQSEEEEESGSSDI